jgi:hypothetical protein
MFKNFRFRFKLSHKEPVYYPSCPGFEPNRRYERLRTNSFIQKTPGSIANVDINIKIKCNNKPAWIATTSYQWMKWQPRKVQKRQIIKTGLQKYCRGPVHCLTVMILMNYRVP